MVRWKTIPVKPETHERLTAYKMGKATYDDIVNGLMDMVPLEEYAAHYLAEQKRSDDD